MKRETTVNDNDFFRGATLQICGTLEIEKSLWQCLSYVCQFVPATSMHLFIYDYELEVLELIATATRSGGTATFRKRRLSPRATKLIERVFSSSINLFERLSDNELTREIVESFGQVNLDRSAMVMDLVLEGEELGVLAVLNDGKRRFTKRHIRLLSLLNEPFAIAITNSMRHRELKSLRDLLADDNRYLQDELGRLTGQEVIGEEFGLRGVMQMVRQVAGLNSPVLLLGETGTGKEVIASTIHSLSYRREGPFIRVNCGAIPETLLDSELFGHEKGAFTGAFSQKRGRFERAQAGTIFLDEIGDLPAQAQVRLLRVLQEKEIERVGGTEPIPVDVRVIAATHRNLETMIAQGVFREDLYFRLKVFPIAIPPLRERTGDIPPLVQHFLQKKSLEMKLPHLPRLAVDAVDRLMAYPWPGNVRELENAVERALILNRGESLTFDVLAVARTVHETSTADSPETTSFNLEMAMSKQIRKALDMAGGKVEGKGGAAELLGLNPGTLRHRMRKLNIPFGRNAKRNQKLRG